MVDLPRVSRAIVTSDEPKSRVSAADISSPYSLLAKSLDAQGEALIQEGKTSAKFGEAAMEIAKPLAREAGAQAVTRDADGNIQVERWPIIGDAGLEYGRAIKVGAVALAESEIGRADIDLRKKFPGDPDSYLKAATTYGEQLTKQYGDKLGPEVGAVVGRIAERAATESYRNLVNQKTQLDLRSADGRIGAVIERTQGEMVALANQGDTSSPAFLERAAKLRDLTNERVKNPLMAYPPERANFELEQFDGQLRATALTHRIAQEIYDRDGPDAAMKAAEAIRTDPGLKLSPSQREAYYAKAVAAVRLRATGEDRINGTISKEIESVEKLASDGIPPSAERLASLQQAVRQTNNPEVVKQYEATVATLPVLASWRQMNPAQLENEIGRLQASIRDSGGDVRSQRLLKSGGDLLKKMRKEIGDDPLGWADRTGSFAVPMIEFGSANAPADMRARSVVADLVARKYGIAPTYLRPEERRFLEVQTANGGNTMLQTAQDIATGFGDRSNAVLAEVSKEAPILAHMGGLLNGGLFGGGSPVFANDVAEAVQLRQNKDFKLPRWLDHPNDKILSAQTGKAIDEYGSAFYMVPNNGRAAIASAQAAYFARANRQGFSALVDDSKSEAAFKRALQEGAGANFDAKGVQYGGIADYKPGYWTNYKVIVPGNIRTDRFKDVLGALRDDDLKLMAISPQTDGGRVYSANDLRAAVPVAVPGGYRFAAGNPASDDPKWIRGADGRPFVLNIDALEPQLRMRVPGAFNGLR